MKLIKIRTLKKNQKISYLLLFVIVLYSTVITMHVGVEFAVIDSVLGTLAIPNGFYSTNFSIPEPEFQISVGLSNPGLLDVTDLEVNVSLNLSYDYLPKNQTIYQKFFSKQEKFGNIRGLSKFNSTIRSEISDFNISVLIKFWENIVNSSNVQFLLDVQIRCNFYFGLIPFTIRTKNIDLFLINCPTCP